jgi:hypothetical protein
VTRKSSVNRPNLNVETEEIKMPFHHKQDGGGEYLLHTNNSPIKPTEDAGIDPFEQADDVSDNAYDVEYDNPHIREGSPSDFGLR